MEYGIEKLRKNNSVSIIGNPKERGSVICFTIKGIHPHDIATILDEDGVAIRAGHHCCQILHEKFDSNGGRLLLLHRHHLKLLLYRGDEYPLL